MDVTLGKKFAHEFKITKDTSTLFIRLSKDKNPLHLDNDFANKKGFGKKIAHGNIQNCFLSYFVGELFPIREIVIVSQSIAYKSPAYEGDVLGFEAKIINHVESVSVYELNFNFKVKSKVISKGTLILKKV